MKITIEYFDSDRGEWKGLLGEADAVIVDFEAAGLILDGMICGKLRDSRVRITGTPEAVGAAAEVAEKAEDGDRRG